MQKAIKFAVALTGVLSCSALHAEEGGFENFLLKSPQHFSPSQNYQVKQQGRFEAFLGFDSGKEEKKAGVNDDSDISGLDIGVAGYWSPDAMFVLGLDVENEQTTFKDISKDNLTTITPSVSVNITPMFSLGLQVNINSGTNENDGKLKDLLGTDSQSVSYTNVTIGATVHQNDWEATLAYQTENKDDKKTYDNSPATFVLHGRYRFIAPLALGLSYQSRDWSSVDDNAKDESTIGVHADATFTPDFGAEFAFFSTTNTGGANKTDATNFVALLQWKVQPTFDVGLRLAYTTIQPDQAGDISVFSPGVFLNTRF